MTIEYIVIGVYLAFLLVLGAIFQRFNSNISDYFRTGCRGTWWLVGSSSFMAGISTYTFTGAAGVAYNAGFSALIVYLASAFGYLLNFLFLAPYFRRIRATTAPEVIKLRFGTSAQQFFAWISAPTYLLGAGLHLYSLAIFSSTMFGFDISVVIIVLGLVVLFYSTTGGSWAVMATDFIQAMILFSVTVVMTIVSLNAMGGFGGFWDLIQKQGLSTDFNIINETGRFPGDKYTWMWALAMFLHTTFGSCSLNAAGRYFAVKDDNDARKAAFIAMLLSFIGALFWFIPPMAARLLFSAEVDATELAKPAEGAYAVIAGRLLPDGMLGVMLVAMFAATMSSMDTGLNRNAAMFSCDIYPALCRFFGWKELKGKLLLRLSQIFTLIFGAMIILMALKFAGQKGKGQFEIILKMVTLVQLPLVIPMFWGLFVKRVPSWSAFASVGASAVFSIVQWNSVEWFGYDWPFHYSMFVGTAVGSLTFFATMPFWKNSDIIYRKQVDNFFQRLATPVDFEKEVGEANDLSQLRIIGLFTAIMGAFILLLLVLDNPLSGRLCILGVGGPVMLVGCGMSWVGIRHVRTGSKNAEKCEQKCVVTESD